MCGIHNCLDFESIHRAPNYGTFLNAQLKHKLFIDFVYRTVLFRSNKWIAMSALNYVTFNLFDSMTYLTNKKLEFKLQISVFAKAMFIYAFATFRWHGRVLLAQCLAFNWKRAACVFVEMLVRQNKAQPRNVWRMKELNEEKIHSHHSRAKRARCALNNNPVVKLLPHSAHEPTHRHGQRHRIKWFFREETAQNNSLFLRNQIGLAWVSVDEFNDWQTRNQSCGWFTFNSNFHPHSNIPKRRWIPFGLAC